MQSTSRNQLEIFCHYEESLGRCNYGDCYAKHKNSTENESVPSLCKSWQEGKCMRWRCRDRHYYTDDDDDVLPQSKRFLDVDRGTSRQTSFSSPYCVKIKKEVIKRRKVEVDLETGRKKSWVESLEQEVLDLTGEASAKKPIRSPMMDRTNFFSFQPHTRPTKRSRSQLPVDDGLITVRICRTCYLFSCKC